jgi:hypothetical protein
MQSRETHPEVFTVTSEPIPVDLSAPREDALETQLGAVPDLSSDPGSAGVAQSPDAMVTRPFSAESDSSQNVRPTWRAPGTTGPQLPLARPHPTTGPPLPQGYPTYVRDPSGPHTAPPPSYSNNAYPLYVPPPQAPEDREPRAKRPRWIVIGIAVAIVVGIVIAIASTGGSSEDAHARTIDAGVAIAAPVVPPPTKPVAVPPVPIDAAPVVAVVADAAPAIVADAPVAAPPRVERPSPADVFAKAMDAGDYSEAVALCVKTGSLVRSSCTLAACRAHDQAHARRWFVAAGSKPSLAATCKSAGTPVEIEKPVIKDKDKETAKKDCEADPMACQH